MTPAASLVVVARWLDQGTEPIINPWDRIMRARDGVAFARWLTDLHTRMPAGEAARAVAIFAHWFDEASHDLFASPTRSLMWLQPAESDVLRDDVLDLAAKAQSSLADTTPALIPPPYGLKRFWIACEYLLHVQLGKSGKIAQGSVADAWGFTEDKTVAVYTCHERRFADRFLAATLDVATSIEERHNRIGEALNELPRVARRSGRCATRLTKVN